MIVIADKDILNRKVDCINKLINEFSLLRLTTKDSDSKDIYNKNIMLLNNQKIKIQKLEFPK